MVAARNAHPQERYVWHASFAPPLPAQVAGEALASIRDQHGGVLDVLDVIDAARPDTAPLHPAFEWDDDRAADEYRKQQARHLIRAIDVVTVDGDAHAAYVSTHVESSDGGMRRAYVQLDAVTMTAAELRIAVTLLQTHVASTERSVLEVGDAVATVGSPEQRLLMARLRQEMEAVRNTVACLVATF